MYSKQILENLRELLLMLPVSLSSSELFNFFKHNNFIMGSLK